MAWIEESLKGDTRWRDENPDMVLKKTLPLSTRLSNILGQASVGINPDDPTDAEVTLAEAVVEVNLILTDLSRLFGGRSKLYAKAAKKRLIALGPLSGQAELLRQAALAEVNKDLA